MSTPAGMRTDSRFAVCTRPSPRQAEQGLLRIRPAPPHVGHTALVTTWPNNDCAERRISPEPPHPGHVSCPEPGSAPLPEQCWQIRSEERRVGKSVDLGE